VIALFITLFKRVNERSFFLLLFLKEQKSDGSFGRSFEKSKKKSDRSFALFKRANELAIA